MSRKLKFLTFVLVLFFGVQFNAQQVFISQGSVWKYLDDGSDQGTAWRETNFNDDTWASGRAQLGYGDGDENTVVSYGDDPSHKYITTYFRRGFYLQDTSDIPSLLVRLLRDDGAVVYLNGSEIVRSNMPSGTINYLTKASSFVAGSEEDTFFEFYVDPSALVIGENIVAVEIHQHSGSSSDISFDFELSATSELPFITRKAPYLIFTGNNTEYKILWQLRRTATCTLKWGTDTTYSIGNIITVEEGEHQHSYTFDELTPATKYYYNVIIDSLEYKGSFVTAPEENADSVKFLVYGDNRSYPADHDAVARKMVNLFSEDPDYQGVVMNVGDMVANGDNEEDWDNQLFDPQYENIAKLLASAGMQSVRGNHEVTGVLFRKYFPYPFVANHYWSFDYGPAHIIMLDQFVAYNTGSPEYNWLVNDLENSSKRWKFIILHEPGWSAGGHENSTEVQSVIQPLCEQYNVQIVFGGHNHYYARAMVNGIVHITTGGGGAPLYDPNPSYPNIVVTSKTHHFCKVDIKGDRLDFQAIDENGNEIDSFNISLTDVEENDNAEIPASFKLCQNYPNPFNPTTTISYSIPTPSVIVPPKAGKQSVVNVTLAVYNALGQKIATLVNKEQTPGNYSVRFNAENLPSGVYFYTLRAGNFVTTKKMVLMK